MKGGIIDMDNSNKDVKKILKGLKRIYANKSADEYKMKGDIKKHPIYDTLSNDISTLGDNVKNAPSKLINGIKDMFESLKKPIWKKMVAEYLAKPDPKNILYTAHFTLGYRYMITAVMFVQTNIKASENGLTYTTPKIPAEENTILDYVIKNGKDFDKYVEKIYKDGEKDLKKTKVTQEAAAPTPVSPITTTANLLVGAVESIFRGLNSVFKTAASLNPISLISACLSRSYDKKVEQYEKVSKELEAAKKAYEEYKKIPAAQRKKRIEHRYVKMIDKYNIKMGNLKAKIDHYDTRASKGSDDDEDEENTKTDAGKGTPSTKSKSSDDKGGDLDF